MSTVFKIKEQRETFGCTSHPNTDQLSSISYLIKPEMLLVSSPLKMPGLNIHYDSNPIAVTHVESRENLFLVDQGGHTTSASACGCPHSC